MKLPRFFYVFATTGLLCGQSHGVSEDLGHSKMARDVLKPFAAEPLKIEAKQKSSDREWKSFETWTLAHATGFQPRAEAAKRDIYGGDPERQVGAKGFFYPKKIDGRWGLVDPEGNLFIHVALCDVSPATGSLRAREAFKEKYGSEENWAEQTAWLLWTNGFNGSGSWSKDRLLSRTSQRVAYCPNWNFMSAYGKKRGGITQQPGHAGYPNDAIFVFDPEFETFALEHARQLTPTKDDPWLLGHFSDNELPINKKSLDNYLGLPQADYGYKAARDWLQKTKGGETDLKNITDKDREAFREFMMERYFSIVAKAIKANDPNHLYLGSRFHGSEKNSEATFRAAGKYCDVISVNLYGAWTPAARQLENWERWSGRPFLVTEFYAKGVDSGMPNTAGAGWLVKTQRDRGLFYQNFCLGLLESKGCVGWHYFKYQDNDMDNKSVDPSNADSNKGIVTAYFDEYPEPLKMFRELNLSIYDLLRWMSQGGRIHP